MKKLLTMAFAISCLLSCSALTANAERNFDSYVAVNEEGNAVIFENKGDIITSTVNKFRIERFSEGGFLFVPEENGRFVVSNVIEAENIINTENGSHFHYFYPVVQTYVVTKKDESISVEHKQDYNGYDRETVEELKKCESIVCFDHFSPIGFDDYYYGEYYSLANGYLPSECYFTYFDYLYETDDKKDCSQFFLDCPPYEPIETAQPPEFTGNSRLIEMGYTSSGLGCDDIFDYSVFEPTGDGKTEFVYYGRYDKKKKLVISAENGQYIPEINITDYSEPIAGDINGDGEIRIADMVSLQNYLLASTKLSSSQIIAADINSDGKVDVFDMIEMRKKFTVN